MTDDDPEGIGRESQAAETGRDRLSRRATLVALGAGGLSALAGCSGPNETDTPTEADDTATPADGSQNGTPDETTAEISDDETTADTPDDEQDGTQTDGEMSEEVRLGVILPLSGTLQSFGKIAVRGLYTYFGYRGADVPDSGSSESRFEVDGVTYVTQVEDSESSPRRAVDAAEEMVAGGDVTALVGGGSAGPAIGIADNVADPEGIPYLASPVEAPALTNDSDTCSEFVFRASETTAMEAVAGASYLANERDDVGSVYIYYADFAYGESLRTNYRRVLENNGVTVAGTEPLPPQYDDDWQGRLEQASDANADAIVGAFAAFTLPGMLDAYVRGEYEFDFHTAWGPRPLTRALGTRLEETLGSGFTAQDLREAGVGPFPTQYHWNQYDNPIARQANQVHRDAFGRNTDAFTSGAFTSAAALVQAVEETGSSDPSDIVDELTGMTVEDTLKGEGAYEFQEYNNQARSPMTVAGVVPTENRTYWDAPIQPGASVVTYGEAETTLPRSEVDCRL